MNTFNFCFLKKKSSNFTAKSKLSHSQHDQLLVYMYLVFAILKRLASGHVCGQQTSVAMETE